MTSKRFARGWAWLAAAAACGLIHAGAQAYWAAGGTWLRDTARPWSVQLQADQPMMAAPALAALAVGMAVLALSPLIITRARYPRAWGIARPIWWILGVGLVLYGGASAIFAQLAFGGFVSGADIDRSAVIGQAFIWNPLLFGWGLTLLAGLWLSRYRGSFSDQP